MGLSRLDVFMECVSKELDLDRVQKADVLALAHAIFENADTEIARTPREYGIGYIKDRYVKFRNDFFDGTDGYSYLPETMPIEFNNEKSALGTCVTMLNKAIPGRLRVSCVIYLNDRYRMPRKTLDEILIHEMVHAWLSYKGAANNSESLIKCGHGTPFLSKANEINNSSDYRITVTNDEPLTVGEHTANRILNDKTVLVVCSNVQPSKAAVARVKRADLGWFVNQMRDWLKRDPVIYECSDADFMNRFKVSRTKMSAAIIPEYTIEKMVGENMLRKIDMSSVVSRNPYSGKTIAAKPSRKKPGYIEYSVIEPGNAFELVAKSYAYKCMLAAMHGVSKDAVQPDPFVKYQATDMFNHWYGKPCTNKLMYIDVPETTFNDWVRSGALTEKGVFF